MPRAWFIVPLGRAPGAAAASPATDLPPDGAGNVAASPWSAPATTPGTALAIVPVEGQTVERGREAVLDLATTGEPGTVWSLAIAIDARTGRLTFAPSKATPSALVATRRRRAAGP